MIAKRLAFLLLVAMALTWTPPALAKPEPMTRDAVMALGKTVVGFSYWWGGAKWQPGATAKGTCTPTGADGCPDCTHSGPWGADCSGFVGKAWQVDKPTALDTYYHPYSTANFTNQETWWSKIAKGDVQKADAFTYNKNGAGHIFLYHKGDPWGSVYAYECKGCASGCVYGLRSVSADYGARQRKLLQTAATCQPHCEGTATVDAKCDKVDCAASAASCVADSLGVRCVSSLCPATGVTQVCTPDEKGGTFATCDNGSLKDPGDCGAYGAWCSTVLGGPATCISAFCAASPSTVPTAGDLCFQGKRLRCDAKGGLTEVPCPPDQPCSQLPGQSGPGSAVCGVPACADCNDGNPCTDDPCVNGTCQHVPNAAPCDDGNPCSAGDMCANSGCLAGPSFGCDDGNPCTSDACLGGQCTHVAQTGSCNDGNACTYADACADGVCAGAPKPCDDANPCTSDSCQDGTCTAIATDGACDDGDGCTVGDSCFAGACTAGAAQSCDDGETCTQDGCEDGACTHSGGDQPIKASCVGSAVQLTSPCTGGEAKLLPCPEDSPCKFGLCGGLSFDPNDFFPPSGDATTTTDGSLRDGLPTGDGGGSGVPVNALVASNGAGCSASHSALPDGALLLLALAGLTRLLRRRAGMRRHGV
jgi:hypothetical protein